MGGSKGTLRRYCHETGGVTQTSVLTDGVLLSCSLLDLVSQSLLWSGVHGLLDCVNLCCLAAFIEFEDNRDAEDAVRKLDGTYQLQFVSNKWAIAKLLSWSSQDFSHQQLRHHGVLSSQERVSPGVVVDPRVVAEGTPIGVHHLSVGKPSECGQ